MLTKTVLQAERTTTGCELPVGPGVLGWYGQR